jgi:hypothetical protein
MARTPRATTPPRAATEPHDGKYNGRAALARGPLGVINGVWKITNKTATHSSR